MRVFLILVERAGACGVWDAAEEMVLQEISLMILQA